MLLARNGLVEDIVTEISDSVPDWIGISERLRNSNLEPPLERGVFGGLVGELSFRICLETIAKKYQGRIVLDPIGGGSSSENYSFNFKDGKLVVHHKGNGHRVTEVDELILADNLPVLCEVKTGSYKNGAGKKKDESSKGTINALRLERINYVTEPLREYFRRECGYIVILPKDQVNPMSIIQKEFIERNGFMATLNFSRREYKYVILSNLSRYFKISTIH